MSSFKDIKEDICTTDGELNIAVSNKQVKVKQYLPVSEKLSLITNVLNSLLSNDYSFVNPVQMDVYTTLEIIFAYTDIEFSDEEKVDPAKLYDELETRGIINQIIAVIPKTEYDFLIDGVDSTIKAYYAYRNSARGIIEDITTDYSNLELDAKNIQEKIADPENLALLKEIITKLG